MANTMTEIWNGWSSEERETIADKAGITSDYLYQVCTERARASVDLAMELDKATDKTLSKKMLRPDVWGEAA